MVLSRHILSVMALALTSVPVAAQSAQVTVPSGQPTIVDRIETYRDGMCQMLFIPTAKPRKNARHGTIQVTQGFWRIGGDGPCADATAHGLIVTYASNPGFTGKDEFSFDVPTKAGADQQNAPTRTYRYKVTVQ